MHVHVFHEPMQHLAGWCHIVLWQTLSQVKSFCWMTLHFSCQSSHRGRIEMNERAVFYSHSAVCTQTYAAEGVWGISMDALICSGIFFFFPWLLVAFGINCICCESKRSAATALHEWAGYKLFRTTCQVLDALNSPLEWSIPLNDLHYMSIRQHPS